MKAKELIEYLSTAYHHNIVERRRVDDKGEPIRPVDEYSLKHKRFGYYHAGGGWSSYSTTNKPNDAQVFTGNTLIDAAYDWTMSWTAIKEM